MKLALIAIALLATTGVVYAACMFCWARQDSGRERPGPWEPGLFLGPKGYARATGKTAIRGLYRDARIFIQPGKTCGGSRAAVHAANSRARQRGVVRKLPMLGVQRAHVPSAVTSARGLENRKSLDKWEKIGFVLPKLLKLQLLVDILFNFYFCEVVNRAVMVALDSLSHSFLLWLGVRASQATGIAYGARSLLSDHWISDNDIRTASRCLFDRSRQLFVWSRSSCLFVVCLIHRLWVDGRPPYPKIRSLSAGQYPYFVQFQRYGLFGQADLHEFFWKYRSLHFAP
jgi:hypothetical protein